MQEAQAYLTPAQVASVGWSRWLELVEDASGPSSVLCMVEDRGKVGAILGVEAWAAVPEEEARRIPVVCCADDDGEEEAASV